MRNRQRLALVALSLVAPLILACTPDPGADDGSVGATTTSVPDLEPAGSGGPTCKVVDPYNCKPPDSQFRLGSARVIRYLEDKPSSGDWPKDPEGRTKERKAISWPVLQGTVIYDGHGNPRGTVTPDPDAVDARNPLGTAAPFNVGQYKTINGLPHAYAWNVHTSAGWQSGWIRQSQIPDLALLKSRAAKTLDLPIPPITDGGLADPVYVMSGGDPGAFTIQPPGSPNPVSLKVTAAHTVGGNEAADYLKRPGDVLNLTYNVPGMELGGFSVDTLPLTARFRRSNAVPAIPVPLYAPGSSTPSEKELHFVYGRVEASAGAPARWGWVPREALTEEPTAAPVLSYPSDGALFDTPATGVPFMVSVPARATHVRITVSTASGAPVAFPGNGELRIVTATDRTQGFRLNVPLPTLPNGSYRWWADAVNADGVSSPSSAPRAFERYEPIVLSESKVKAPGHGVWMWFQRFDDPRGCGSNSIRARGGMEPIGGGEPTWGSWVCLGGVATNGPKGGVWYDPSKGATAWVVVVGGGGLLYERTMDPSSAWSPWRVVRGESFTSIERVEHTGSNIHAVYVLASSGKRYVIYRDWLGNWGTPLPVS